MEKEESREVIKVFRKPPKYRPNGLLEFPYLPVFVRSRTLDYSLIGATRAANESDAQLITTDSPAWKWAHWNGNKIKGGLFHPKDFHLADNCDGIKCRFRIRLRAVIRKRDRMRARDFSGRMSPSLESPRSGPYHDFLISLINDKQRAKLILQAWKFKGIGKKE